MRLSVFIFLNLVCQWASAHSFYEKVEHGQYHQYCQARENFYKQEKLNIAQAFSGTDFSETEIVFLGEPHSNYQLEIYPILVKELEKNKFNTECFLLEADQNSFVLEALDRVNQLPPEQGLEELRLNLPTGFSDFAFEMHRQGKKLYAVDNHRLPNESGDPINLNARDAYMSEEILKLIKDQKCQRMLMAVGSLHVSSLGINNRVNLREHLTDRGVQTRSIHINILGLLEPVQGAMGPGGVSREVRYTSSSWLLKREEKASLETAGEKDFVCLNNPSIPTGPYALKNKSSQSLGLHYKDSLDSIIVDSQDFDFSLIYSCASQKCAQENAAIQSHLESIGLVFY